MAKTKKSVDSVPTEFMIAQMERIDALEKKQAEILKKQAIIVEGFEFIADEVRPIFGMGHLARVFDAVFNKLTK